MNFLKKLEKAWVSCFTAMALGCMIGLFLLLLANVILRISSNYYPIAFKMSWYSDVQGMMFAYMTMFTAALLCQQKGHFRVDLLQLKLGHHRYYYILEVITYLIAFGFYAMFFYYSYILTRDADAFMTVLPITKRWCYLCMPISAFFLCVFTLRDVWDSLAIVLKLKPVPEKKG